MKGKCKVCALMWLEYEKNIHFYQTVKQTFRAFQHTVNHFVGEILVCKVDGHLRVR